MGEGPALLLLAYYAVPSHTPFPNGGGATRDRERHCYAACMTKRFLPCNVTPEITIVLMEGLGGIPANGFDDSWRDAASHFWGIWV